jgi:hypothetical protein
MSLTISKREMLRFIIKSSRKKMVKLNIIKENALQEWLQKEYFIP